MPPLRGLVLAGGQSRRMGQDKAGIVVAGNTLLERTVALLATHVADVHVSVRDAQRADPLRGKFSLITDQKENIGPAAGLLAAHGKYDDAAWLVVACDMPALQNAEISALIAARSCEFDAVAWLAADESGPEPLCAIYEPGNLASFATYLKTGGDASPRAWLRKSKTKLVGVGVANRLTSINEPADLEQLQNNQDAAD